jgi:hypothetical protein
MIFEGTLSKNRGSFLLWEKETDNINQIITINQESVCGGNYLSSAETATMAN